MRLHRKHFAMAVAAVIATSPALAATKTLTMRVRDFRGDGTTSQLDNSVQEHPDFENLSFLTWSILSGNNDESPLKSGPAIPDSGILGPLGSAINVGDGIDPYTRKPVFVSAQNTVTDATSFSSWYNDDPTFNKTVDIPLMLTDIGGGVFQYESNAFYPIDGQVLGNTVGGEAFGGYTLFPFPSLTTTPVPPDHNWHFTVEIHDTFTYMPGQTFTFEGDDDMWVYINDELVMDRGGVNSVIERSVDLDTLGLTAGESYMIDIFFAERHTDESNFRITTSIFVPEPGMAMLLAPMWFVALRRRR